MHENFNASLDYTRSNTIRYFSNLYLEYCTYSESLISIKCTRMSPKALNYKYPYNNFMR